MRTITPERERSAQRIHPFHQVAQACGDSKMLGEMNGLPEPIAVGPWTVHVVYDGVNGGNSGGASFLKGLSAM